MENLLNSIMSIINADELYFMIIAKQLREKFGLYFYIEPVVGNRWTIRYVDLNVHGEDSDYINEEESRKHGGYKVYDKYLDAVKIAIEKLLQIGREKYNKTISMEYNDKIFHNKPVHINKHDIVVVESYDKLHKWICEYKMYVNNQLYFFKGTYKICSYKEVNESKLIYDSYYDIDYSSEIIRAASPGEITQFERMIEKNNTTNHTTNVLTELLEHIKNTSKEELEKEFKEIEKWSNVGPTVDEFMNFCNKVNEI